MRSKVLLGGLVASALLMPAYAQQNNPPANAPRAQQPAAENMRAAAARAGQWRASKLIGLNVYNEQNEKLGDISEILLDQSGKVAGVVIGVGGFLGLGQHDIMVSMDKIKFVDEPVRTSMNTSGSAADRPAATARADDRKWYPDHAILSGATKDLLKSMTQFKY